MSETREARLYTLLRDTERENERLRAALRVILSDCRRAKDPVQCGKLRARIINQVAATLATGKHVDGRPL